MKKVYVAASQHDYLRARYAMSELKLAGFTITHDWTVEVEEHRDRPGSDDELYEAAQLDFRGVVDCDVLLVLTPVRQDWGCAMWTELGIALDRLKRCIITGPQRDRNIFARFGERYEYDRDGIDCIIAEAA